MSIKYESILLKDSEFLKVYEKIIKNCETHDLCLEKLPLERDLYHYLKSYRSNVTEGNTTSIGDFTKIVIGEEEEIIGETQDNILEIKNLKKAYDISMDKKLSVTLMSNIHSILSTQILKNNLYLNGGRYKTINNYVNFKISDNEYVMTTFTDKSKVKSASINLFENIKNLPTNSKYSSFAKSIILHNELISIHPFIDGNGRTSRVLSEYILEQSGYLPYIPHSTEKKRDYQNMMGEFSADTYHNGIMNAYDKFSVKIIINYEENTINFLNSYYKMEQNSNKSNQSQ